MSSALSSRSCAARETGDGEYQMFELILCNFDSYVLFMSDIYIFDWSNIVTRRILIYMIYVTNDFDGSCQYNLTFSFSKLLAFSKTLIILFVYVIITSI